MGEAAARAGRVLFEDVKPYDVLASWADLAGPAVGVIELPLTVYWGPPRVFDLAHPGHGRTAYEAVLSEGRCGHPAPGRRDGASTVQDFRVGRPVGGPRARGGGSARLGLGAPRTWPS